MTLIKSLLLGSAAGIVAVASAQAADLPTRKGAPAAQYVKICTITANGKPITGFVLPGSDTCFKIGGYLTGQVEAGNLKTGYGINSATGRQAIGYGAPEFNRNGFGYTTRENISFDAVSNTAYGPLAFHGDIQNENGNGFDTDGSGTYINEAYLTWAGITAGKAESFYSFVGGGPGWANFFSPDEKGFNQPDLMAYTASFGGGLTLTFAAQSAGTDSTGAGAASSGGGTNMLWGAGNTYGAGPNATQGGMRSPDFVAALKISQGWGSAQVSGVAHNVRATAVGLGGNEDDWGWGIDAGISFNLPSFGPGDDFFLTGSYTERATWYSGLPDAMWGEDGQVNGNGQGMALFDTYFNPDGSIAKPTAWSVSATADFHVGSEFTFSPEGSYGEINWNGTNAGSLVSDSRSWLVGGVAHYDPVTNLDFEVELVYQNSHTDTPNGYVASLPGSGNTIGWKSNSDGFAGRFEVTRNF
jgi:hypothetical protein